MDLKTYFTRIGYHGPATATLDTLNGIILAHTSSIAFENIDVLLKRPISIDPDALWDKLVVRKRGGYCFEQNGLLLAMLKLIGFAVVPVSGRVRVDRERSMIPPRTHMFLRVEVDGQSLFADVGVGDMTPTCALPVPARDGSNIDRIFTTPHEARRFTYADDGAGPRRWFHQALRTEWRDVCEFTFEEMPTIDQELANWFTSAHPKSHFKNRLVVARTDGAGRRHTLLNRELIHRHADGRADSLRIASPGQLREVLGDVFHLRFDVDAELRCEGLNWND